ncbi:o-succinylbenzoate--CoA ligase [Shewanella maritima]|uniref:o-succinylbenzoate--CoA ligase n=1 Tax=Shewanella maritima TaxID=2520507 RepID=UPI003734D19F
MISPIHQQAQQSPAGIAVSYYSNSGQLVELSYQTLSQQVSLCQSQLRLAGISKGDIIACIAPNSIEMVKLYWACVDLGCLFFPISPRFSDQKIDQLLQRFEVKFAYSNDKQLISSLASQSITWIDQQRHQSKGFENDNPALEVDPSTPQNIILTSGSTGQPKAAVHCLNNHIYSAQGSQYMVSLLSRDSWLLSLPLFHIGGLAILNRCALIGATVVLRDDKQSLAQQLLRQKITHVSLVPTQANSLLSESPRALCQLKALLLGGGMIEQQLVNALSRLNVATYTSYGMTEMSSQITTSTANHLGFHGKALPHRELSLRQGVIWVKGPCLFLGYLDNGVINLPVDNQGWFCTKDKGELNQNGELAIVGRVDNMFICGGENIQPEEIEAVLLQHSNVKQAIVFAMPDAKFDKLPAAIVDYVDTSLTAQTNEQLSQSVIDKLARFKRPRQFFAWPQGLEAQGLKVSRKQVIASANVKKQ